MLHSFLISLFISSVFSITSVYYGNWKVYDRDFPLCKLPLHKIDRLFYVFTDTTSGKCKFADDYIDLFKLQPIDGNCNSKLQEEDAPLKGNFYSLQIMKRKFKQLKVFFVIGGFMYSDYMHEYVMTNDTKKMQGFVSSCVEMFKNHSFVFDGIDVDYEYPCLYDDNSCGNIVPEFNEKELYVKFIEEFRRQLGPNVLLSIATSAEYKKIDALDLRRLESSVDIYNVMTYDFTSGSQGSFYTGHHTQPHANEKDPVSKRKYLSAELAGDYFVSNGANSSKINLGVAFYGRGFTIDKKISLNSSSPFLKSLGPINFGTWEIGMLDYYDIQKNYSDSNSSFRDSKANAPYILDVKNGVFITYDDELSIKEKSLIVEIKNYEGLFAYEITGDDQNFSLLNAMNAKVYAMTADFLDKLAVLDGIMVAIIFFLFFCESL